MTPVLIRLPLLVICLSIGLHTGSASGEPPRPEDLRRLRVGLNVFSAVLGAQEALEAKRSSEGALEKQFFRQVARQYE